MNLNDFSNGCNITKSENLRGSEYFPYPLYINSNTGLLYTFSILSVLFSFYLLYNKKKTLLRVLRYANWDLL